MERYFSTGASAPRCAMRDSCGKKGLFGKDLPCPYDGPPKDPEDDHAGPICCTLSQVEALRDNFNQVEPIISPCPACRNNFRSFFCDFTCSPNQGSFVNVTSTQKTNTEQTAVKSVDFFVAEAYGRGFFSSCKDVKVGATNGYAMDLIGGGAKDYAAFLKYMGDEKPLGSPFQIDFPQQVSYDWKPLNSTPRNCYDTDLTSRCTCIDCESICLSLPAVPPPNAAPTCHIGPLSCLTFILLMAYAFAVLGFLGGYIISTIRRRREKTYERVALSADTSSPRVHYRGLVGVGSLVQHVEEESSGVQSESRQLGRGASLLDPIETVQPRQYRLNNILRRGFYRLGLFAATSPWLTLASIFLVMGLLNIGWKNFEIETDPVRLWVSPTSESKLQKEYFDENFGPFYRTEQIFVTSVLEETEARENDSFKFVEARDKAPVLTWDHLTYWFDVEADIRALESSNGYKLDDSVAAWFQNSLDDYDKDTWEKHLTLCAESPVDCLPDFQQPLAPHYVLGGVPTKDDGSKSYAEAEAFVVTYVVANSLNTAKQAMAMDWERTLRSYLLGLSKIAFSTEVSLEEEINKSTNMDVKIVVLSYLAMFLYVALTLGSGATVREDDSVLSSLAVWARNFPRIFSRSHVTSSSLSTDSRTTPHLFPRLPRTFLSVIPFLVLAVGVDNVFILVHELDRQNLLHGPNAAPSLQNTNPSMSPTNSHRSPFESTNEEVDTASMPLYLTPEERMGPSILLSTITETAAFTLGALVPMPAVRNFALYAAGSVFLNATLQVTVFISALLLDLKRTEAGRVDCFPCVVLLAFGGIFVLSVISMQHIELGLDQRLALPSDSYLVSYFDNMDAYFDVGPPKAVGQQKLCSRFTTCDDLSVVNTLEAERKRHESSFISEPSAPWIDDFLGWLDPAKEDCCRVRKRNPTVFCSPRDSARMCQPCFKDRQPQWNITMEGLPENDEFMYYLNHWLDSPTTAECPLAGKSSYGTALSINGDSDNVIASHFRTFHSPLKSQSDFINAFAAAHRIADKISERLGVEIFPYSIFYVFFDQYAHIIAVTQEVLGLGLASVLIVTALMLGSWRTGTIVTGVVSLTVVSVMGVMSIWSISLNAISLVNLVISLGIAVEFCAHIARAFMSAGSGLPVDHPAGQKERDERMWTAMVDVGPSVLSGITFTKLIGMSVLALTHSKLLETYYFRMWLTLIVSGALHGLVLLPVVLSLAGGPGFPQQEADEEWMSNAIRSDYEYAPFLADDDSVTSD
ncbi:multidrug efflux transporter AcrB transmembrane domain-containing protein [Cyathus striatus]|nr:multidrug efflux transporter AcrB transmembrane domain-containing protein [Cyathus striatus]